jgi:hypothetical protein
MIQTTLKKEVLEKYKNSYFFETGTANGDCVRLALEVGFEKIYSIEIDDNLQNENKIKYKSEIDSGKVILITGDSLQELIKVIPSLDKPTTFWLDAHVDFGPCGIKKCPLYEELHAIKESTIKNHTILIDDIRVFGDHWGEDISIYTLKDIILSINPNYNFTFENNTVTYNDILAAYAF